MTSKTNRKLPASAPANDPVINKINTPPFLRYLAGQKWWLLSALALMLLGFAFKKLAYPFPDFDPDATNYMDWAYNKLDVAYRPLGYTHFLSALHTLHNSLFVVADLQYIVFCISMAFAFFSLDFHLPIHRHLKIVLLVMAFINPALLIQSNIITSDSLFCSLTVVLLTVALWFCSRAHWILFALLLCILYLCLELRYAALFYPAVLFLTILLCRTTWIAKTIYTATVVLFTFQYVQSKKSLNEYWMDVSVFSGFSGWQMANNALYCYKHIDIQTADLPTPATQAIDAFVKAGIDSVHPANDVGDDYIWAKNSPLKAYVGNQLLQKKNMHFFQLWYQNSPDLDEYGRYIATHFPAAFTRYYLLPNLQRFFYPPPMGTYNSHNTVIMPVLNDWFNCSLGDRQCNIPATDEVIVTICPAICTALNLTILITIPAFLVMARRSRGQVPKKLWLLFVVWNGYYLLFMGFSVFASAIYLRFLDTVLALGFIYTCVLWQEIFKIKKQGAEMQPIPVTTAQEAYKAHTVNS